MSFPLFKDIGKNSNDLLKKGFPSTDRYAFRVELDTTTNSGIQFTPFLQETLSKSIEGELKAKFNYRDVAFTTTGNMKEDVSLEIAHQTKKGAKLTVALNSNMGNFVEKLKGKAGLELRTDYTTSAIAIEAALPNNAPHKPSDDLPKATLSSVFGSKEKGIAFGIDLEASPTTQELKSINGAIAYNTSDLEFTVFSKTKGNAAMTVGANYFQKYPYMGRDVLLGAELTYDLSGKGSAFVIGAQFKPDESSTIKGKFDSKGLLGLNYTEKWKGPLSVTFTSDTNLLGGESPFQYGVKLAFK